MTSLLKTAGGMLSSTLTHCKIEKFESSKSTFRIVLAPIFELLVYKKEKLSQQDWLDFVARTETSIKLNPQQFLGNDLPNRIILDQAVSEIFLEFIENESVEA